MTPLTQTVSKEDHHAFLTSCLITSAGLGWKGHRSYELYDPVLIQFSDEDNHLYILNWIALCFASLPNTHAAVSLFYENGHFTFLVTTKGGDSYLRSTAGDNEFVLMTQELLKRQITSSPRTSKDMFQDREFAEGYLIRWCWPAFWGKVQALQNTLLQLGKNGRLDTLIEQWIKYREGSSLPFDQASVFELMHSETPKSHSTLSKESFKELIKVISSRTEPKTTTKTADTLAKEKHEAYYEIMKSCLALDRCDFIRKSVNGPAGGNVRWRKSIDAGTQLLMEDLFHQVQRLLEYHLGLITYLSHGLPYFRTALTANNGDLKKAVSIHYVTSSPNTPATLTSVTLKDAPKVWIPKVFSENGIEKSFLDVTDKEMKKLISTCEHLWKAGDVIHLTTHTLCDMAHYIVHEKKDLYCEAIGTSDIPCIMCNMYVFGLRNLTDQKRVRLRHRSEMTAFHGTWTPPPHTETEMKSLISDALSQLNTSMDMYLEKNGLRGNEVDQSVLDAFGLTNADLASMQ